ncbi:unnamed protein product [Cylicostephanus goldi]|uniref:Uncharacterized protein n=1 Tax=Cylicostephanus goldi TaxID=71465 RepID=A0A3P6S0P7_CYLGO|nr:unnamed protein product [Cylicostephanus goldi]
MLVTAHLFYSALSFIILERALSLKPVYFSGNCNALKRNRTGLRARLEKAISTAAWIRYNCYVEKLARKNVKNVLSTNPYKYKHGNLILEGLLIYNKWPFGEEALFSTVKQFAKELKKVSYQLS